MNLGRSFLLCVSALVTVSRFGVFAQAAAIPVNNSFFDLPASGLPTNTTSSWNESDNPAISGWSLLVAGTPPTGAGVQVGGQPGQLPGHHQAYGRVYDPAQFGLISIRQDVGPLAPNTTYTLTVGVAAGVGDADGIGYGTIGFVEGHPDIPGSFYSFSPFAAGTSFTDVSLTFTTGPVINGDLGIALDVVSAGAPGNGIEFNEVDFQNVRLDAVSAPEPSAIALGTIAVSCLGLGMLAKRARRPRASILMRSFSAAVVFVSLSGNTRAAVLVLGVDEGYSAAAQAGTGETILAADGGVISSSFDLSGMQVAFNTHNLVTTDGFYYEKGAGPWASISVEGASEGLNQPSANLGAYANSAFLLDPVYGPAVFAESVIEVRGYVAAGDIVRMSIGNDVGILPTDLQHSLNWEISTPGPFAISETRHAIGGAQVLQISSHWQFTVIRGIGVTERTWIEAVDPVLGLIQANSVTVSVPEPGSLVLLGCSLMCLAGLVIAKQTRSLLRCKPPVQAAAIRYGTLGPI